MTIIASLPYTGFGVDADNNLVIPQGIKSGVSGSELPIFNPLGGFRTVARVSFGATELSGSEVNTSFTFPANGAILHNAFIYVLDGESGTMDVGTQGTSNDPDGILDGITLTNTGWVFPAGVLTTGSNEVYLSAATFGALSHQIELGTDVAGNTGFIVPRGAFITGADPVSITSSGDLNSCSGYLFLDYTALPSVA
jgi:hypothetical protein